MRMLLVGAGLLAGAMQMAAAAGVGWRGRSVRGIHKPGASHRLVADRARRLEGQAPRLEQWLADRGGGKGFCLCRADLAALLRCQRRQAALEGRSRLRQSLATRGVGRRRARFGGRQRAPQAG